VYQIKTTGHLLDLATKIAYPLARRFTRPTQVTQRWASFLGRVFYVTHHVHGFLEIRPAAMLSKIESAERMPSVPVLLLRCSLPLPMRAVCGAAEIERLNA
jgi:hypothetical protein